MLLIENANIQDITTEGILNETTKEKEYFVHGIFMRAEAENKNHRKYPKHILEKQVNKFISESVNTGSSFGELTHPEHLDVDPYKTSHRITMLEWDSNAVYGKAKILDNPTGNIAKSLIQDGVGKISMSSRGSGSVKEGFVQDDYRLITVDLVLNPSVVDAVMTMIREKEELLLDNNVDEMTLGILIEDIKNNKINRRDFDRELIKRFKMLFK